MSDNKPKPGTIGWVDLTVEHADQIRDFYSSVVGWKPEAVEMDGYTDFNMMDTEGRPAAGICYHDGPNVGIPPQWMVYISVKSLALSLAAVKMNGGTVIREPEQVGSGSIAFIQDPAGAVCALYQP